MAEVCVLPNRFIPSSKRTEILSLNSILPNFIKIGQKLFEIIELHTQRDRHTDTHTHRDTYTPMKIIPVKNKVFGPGNEIF